MSGSLLAHPPIPELRRELVAQMLESDGWPLSPSGTEALVESGSSPGRELVWLVEAATGRARYSYRGPETRGLPGGVVEGTWDPGEFPEDVGAWSPHIEAMLGPASPCGWCGSVSGYETDTDGWTRCRSCGGN